MSSTTWVDRPPVVGGDRDDVKAILWLAIEDYSGLWEAVWELRTDHPEVGAAVLADRARDHLVDLIDRGLVRLYRCQEPYGDLAEIEDHEVGEVLATAENWFEPGPGSVSIRFGATASGEAASLA